jgi:hypothetical protein
MEQVSAGNNVFKCAVNEVVTLTFAAHNTDILITYRIDDGPSLPVMGNSLAFPSDRPLMILQVVFHFNGDNGSYDIRVSGSAGGSFPDLPPAMQSHDIPPIRRYAFTH